MKNTFLFLLFVILLVGIYFGTQGAGLVTDTVGWIETYEQNGWQGIFNAFGDRSLHYVYQTVFFTLWKICGLNGYAWMSIFVTLHAVIGVLVFRLFQTLFKAAKVPSYSLVALAGSVLFLLSPYHTEPLVWYACIHYLVSTLLLLFAFRAVLWYVIENKIRYVILFYVFYLLALFALEISFVFPIILLLFFLFWPIAVLYGTSKFKLIKLFVVPSLLCVAMYFALSQLFRGSIVGHYGAETHLNFHIPLLMGNLAKYMAKIFFLAQFIKPEWRNALYAIFENEKFGWLFFVLLLSITFIFLFNYKKWMPRYGVIFILFGFFVLALLPILNLFITYIVNVENDRFAYFASVFAFPLLVLFCTTVFRKFGWLLVIMFLFFEIKCLLYNTASWQGSGIMNNALTSNFKWNEAKTIYLLNMPDNFRGAYLFRGFPPDNSFELTMQQKYAHTFTPAIKEVLLCNLNATTDGVTVEKISATQLKVTFKQWGNWWWNKGVGVSNYSTNTFSVQVDEWGHSYLVTFTQKEPGAVYLYQSGLQWIEVSDF